MHLHLRPDIRSLSSCEQAESTLVTLLGVDCYGEAGALCELQQCCRRRQLSEPLSTRSLVNMHPLPLSDAKDILTRPTILCSMQLVELEKAWETRSPSSAQCLFLRDWLIQWGWEIWKHRIFTSKKGLQYAICCKISFVMICGQFSSSVMIMKLPFLSNWAIGQNSVNQNLNVLHMTDLLLV